MTRPPCFKRLGSVSSKSKCATSSCDGLMGHGDREAPGVGLIGSTVLILQYGTDSVVGIKLRGGDRNRAVSLRLTVACKR